MPGSCHFLLGDTVPYRRMIIRSPLLQYHLREERCNKIQKNIAKLALQRIVALLDKVLCRNYYDLLVHAAPKFLVRDYILAFDPSDGRPIQAIF